MNIKDNKRYIKNLVIIIISSLFLNGCGDVKTQDTIRVLSASTDYVGANYETVMMELQKAGFKNIETEEIEDLSSLSSTSDGEVEKVVIDGNMDFEKDQIFSCEVKVVVTYHAIKKIAPPISPETIQNYDYESIAKEFERVGFINVKTEEVFDIDPDSMETNCINEVAINGKTVFDIAEKFPYDSQVSVIYHRPYEKFTVKIHVNCVENLFFSKYDIDILLNNEKKEQLAHGKEDDYEFRLKKGEYTLIFAEAGSSSTKGTETIDVSSDMEISYKLFCHSDNVSIETVYIDKKIALGENEVKVGSAASDYKYKNYKEVISALETEGFTNIKTQIIYDIYWGFTQEGEVDSVTIDGESDFKRGDIFAKDAEIIVVYHMPQESNPSKSIEEQESQKNNYLDNDYRESNTEEEEEVVLTVDNCGDLEELLSSEDYKIIEDFVSKYKGRKIEFDGYVANIANHSDGSKTYKTRFDYLIYVGNSEQEHITGPCIQFRNVNYYDFHLVGSEPDSITVNTDLHIIAEVVEFNSLQGLLILKPCSTSIK